MFISARELKRILLGETNFSKWIKEIIKKYNFKENIDYFIKLENVNSIEKIKMLKKNYYLTEIATRRIVYGQRRSIKAEEIKERIKNGEKIEEIIEQLRKDKNGKMTIIAYEDEEYPELLRKIKKPPQKLYVKGNIENLKECGIAVIGTRKCSNYGRQICKIFANNLVGYNLNIISGLAVGIDSIAHKACMESKGKTIAVLPSGLDNIFPKENEGLLNRILENGGTVITEYPPEFEKTAESCRERNRIISGLAIATLVIEAGKYSGTSTTVRFTKEQNKKAFCIPSSLLNSKGSGTNQMIKEKKAQLVTSVEDIIEELSEFKLVKKVDFDITELKHKKSEKTKKVQQKNNVSVEEENLEIYNLLLKGAKGINEIVQELNKPIDEITYKLTLLELEGAIEELPGKKFKIKKG